MLAVTFKWEIRQLDVNNAFLNGFLQEDVYMRQPEGFIDSRRPHHVCKLIKAIYGLRQAPRAWFDRLRLTLLSWGFRNARSDTSLFMLRSHNLSVFILVYVDDILITGSDSLYVERFVRRLNQIFSLKDLGPLYYFLGLEVFRDGQGIYLNQAKYTVDLLKRFGMSDCASVSTPMVTDRLISANDGDLLSNLTEYRQAIGSLQYLTTTRPDIAYAVNKLSQFLSQPRTSHLQAVKRVFRYLKGTFCLGLHIKPLRKGQIFAYTDADWACDVDDRKSTAEMCLFLANTLISWFSRKQKVVSRSSAESEYRSLADGSAEIQWLNSLLIEIGLYLRKPSVIWCDNLSARALAANPVQHARSKHIEIDVHFVRDLVQSGSICVRYVPSKFQIADCLTKPLSQPQFQFFKNKLGLAVAPSRLRGSVRL